MFALLQDTCCCMYSLLSQWPLALPLMIFFIVMSACVAATAAVVDLQGVERGKMRRKTVTFRQQLRECKDTFLFAQRIGTSIISRSWTFYT